MMNSTALTMRLTSGANPKHAYTTALPIRQMSVRREAASSVQKVFGAA